MHDSLRCRRIVPSGRREIAWPRFTKIMAWLVGTFSFSKLSKISSPTTAGESIPILNGIWNFEMVELSRTFARWGLLNRSCVLKKKEKKNHCCAGLVEKGKVSGKIEVCRFPNIFVPSTRQTIAERWPRVVTTLFFLFAACVPAKLIREQRDIFAGCSCQMSYLTKRRIKSGKSKRNGFSQRLNISLELKAKLRIKTEMVVV